MRLRNVKNAQEILDNSPYVLSYKQAKEYRGQFNELCFCNFNPICLEIGMGKGQFIIEMAKKYPDINFIGIEMYESVMCRAVQKLEEEKLDNLKLICVSAETLNDIFISEIDTIYLNFSDPWPKNRHAKRRLTSSVFLEIYDSLFKGDKQIIQKTDNELLFASSIVSLSEYGYTLKEVYLDLHATELDNCMTEYEEKFSSKGVKIKYLKAVKK